MHAPSITEHSFRKSLAVANSRVPPPHRGKLEPIACPEAIKNWLYLRQTQDIYRFEGSNPTPSATTSSRYIKRLLDHLDCCFVPRLSRICTQLPCRPRAGQSHHELRPRTSITANRAPPRRTSSLGKRVALNGPASAVRLSCPASLARPGICQCRLDSTQLTLSFPGATAKLPPLREVSDYFGAKHGVRRLDNQRPKDRRL